MKPFNLLLAATIALFTSGYPKDRADIKVRGVQNPVISLNGIWKFSMTPPEHFWQNSVDFSTWPDIRVPGECQMQGFAIQHDRSYVYKHRFDIPDDYKAKKIFLNFYGVYSYAKIWINGLFVRDHFGGFTKWSADISDYVTPGEKAVLTVEIVDRTDDISFASGYAKHQIGGILRNVELAALPVQNLRQLFLETDWDDTYETACLNVQYELAQKSAARLKVEVYTPAQVKIASAEHASVGQNNSFTIPDLHPEKWDAEHPVLYTVVATLIDNGIETMKTSRKTGFREVSVQGNALLVNGKPVKLRGACRHDMHPLLGRMTTSACDLMDVRLAKEANMNFIRTSHYPPSETFLDYCDEYGIYVEDETAVCFVGSHRTKAYQASGSTQNDSAFTSRYLSQLEEMVQNHRNHPSVLIWSIGNENVFGSNFVKSFHWVKQHDTTRPVMYSYPGHAPDSLKIYDIISMHYPDWRGNLSQLGIETKGFHSNKMPMLFDEWAHVACYNNYELKDDPNVRNFWGQSLDSMWTRTFASDGGLGGAIWCMIDETFMLPENLEGYNQWWGILDPNVIPAAYMGPCVGYGEWGILDTWRRKKPEFWNTKKAYSPTKIYLNKLEVFQPGKEITVPVHNRFDHTNFSELNIQWKYGKKTGKLNRVHLPPHATGILLIPANDWNSKEKLNLRFFTHDTFLVDEYNLSLGERKIERPQCAKGNLHISEKENLLAISGEKVSLHLNKKTGVLENINIGDEVIIKSGPYINFRLPGRRVQYPTVRMEDYAVNWKLTNLEYDCKDGIAIIRTAGTYDSLSAGFTITIDDNGVFSIDYAIQDAPLGKNIQEAGIKFIVGDAFQKLAWERESYFNAYPENHLGSPAGEVTLNMKPKLKYREKPGHGWESDSKNFYYFGLGPELPYTNLARSLKENIYTFTLKTVKSSMAVYSDGKQAARFDNIEAQNTVLVNDIWDYNSLLWGNYAKNIKVGEKITGTVIFEIQ